MPEGEASVPPKVAAVTAGPGAAVAPGLDGHAPDAQRLVTLTAGVLANIQSVVGEGAAQALFRYGAFEEGKRLAQEAGAARFETALATFDQVFGHESSGTKTQDGGVEIRLQHCSFIREDRRALDLLLIGLYEGMLQAVMQVRYKGQIVGRQADGGAVLRFELDPSNA